MFLSPCEIQSYRNCCWFIQVPVVGLQPNVRTSVPAQTSCCVMTKFGPAGSIFDSLPILRQWQAGPWRQHAAPLAPSSHSLCACSAPRPSCCPSPSQHPSPLLHKAFLPSTYLCALKRVCLHFLVLLDSKIFLKYPSRKPSAYARKEENLMRIVSGKNFKFLCNHRFPRCVWEQNKFWAKRFFTWKQSTLELYFQLIAGLALWQW